MLKMPVNSRTVRLVYHGRSESMQESPRLHSNIFADVRDNCHAIHRLSISKFGVNEPKG